MSALGVANRVLTWIFTAGAGASMFGVFGITFFNALRRYAIGRSYEWGEELPVYLAIYGIMFGCALAYMQGRHISFTIIVDLLPARFRDRLDAVIDLVMVVTGALLAISGWLFAERRGDVESAGLIGTARHAAEATGLPALEAFGHMAVWQTSLTLGGALVAMAAMVKLLEKFSRHRGWRVLP